jgi:hypothetical protein
VIKDTLQKLYQFTHAKDIQVIEFYETQELQILSANALLKDGSKIYVHERISLDKSHYSYHWQDRDDNLMLRFDDAPHHKEIETFPHHQHEGEEIKPLKQPTFDHFLQKISQRF